MRDNERTNEQTLKIELLSQWKLEAEFRNISHTLPRGQFCCHVTKSEIILVAM